jgi:hypothetical protein
METEGSLPCSQEPATGPCPDPDEPIPAHLIFLDFIVLILKLSLCLTKRHAMKTYKGSGVTAPRILDLSTRWR